MSFVHVLVGGGVVSGSATSRIEADPDRPGCLLLVEDFEVDGVPHRSICAEVRRPATGVHRSRIPMR